MKPNIEVKDVRDLREPVPNPFLKVIAEKAAAQAAIDKLRIKAQDAFWLASMEVRKLDREAATFPVLERGVAFPPGFQRRVEQAQERVAQAEHAFQQAAKRAQQANAELNNAQKAAEVWRYQEAHLASQAAAEAALPPAERERRQLRARLAQLEGGR